MLSVKPLSKDFAGAVDDVNLADAISDRFFSEILEAWAKYPVLVFRNQDLGIGAHQQFASRFGKLVERARPKGERGANAQDNPYVMIVSNVRENGQLIGSQGDGALSFHSDGAFNDIPSQASLLYGIEIPKEGGDTLFINMNEVYESLNTAIRNVISDKWAVNYHTYDRSGAESGKTPTDRGKNVRHAIHPMVIAHPVTRKPVLFVNCLHTREIIGMAAESATPLLNELFAETERPERIYAHKWRKGDLLIWDNRCLQHGRSDWEPKERRLMRRFAVRCADRPQPYSQAAKDTEAHCRDVVFGD